MKPEFSVWTAYPSIEILKVKNISHDFPRHIHKRTCLGLIESGVKTLVMNGKARRLEKGDIYLIPAHRTHACRTHAGRTVSYTVICAETVDQLAEGAALDDERSGSGRWKELDKFIGRSFPGPQDNDALLDRRVRKIVDFIETHYMEPLSIRLLAESVRLEPCYFLRLFKKAVGIPVHEYIIQTRVRNCKGKAATPTQNAWQAALDCGFYDQSHFLRNFKKHTGTTPRKYFDSIKNL